VTHVFLSQDKTIFSQISQATDDIISMSEFHSSIFGCFEDISSCLCGICFPCLLQCKNWAEAREESCGLPHICCPVCEYWTRQHLRDRNGMNQDCFTDVLCLCICYPCVVCQDAREAAYLNRNGIGQKKNLKEKKSKKDKQQTIVIAGQQPVYMAPPPAYAPQPSYPQGYAPPPPGYAPQTQGYAPQ